MVTFTLWPRAWSLCRPHSGSRGWARSPGPGVPECAGADGPRPGLPATESVQHAVDVVLPAQALEERDEVQQLCVRHVIEPGLHGHLRDRQRGRRQR